ncbi:hypothetical protein A0H81_04923 [Grifola frondosa]|uniref:Uncharacterized protein n=1 Tax=Grifola frondosa TaxID=5627 RepID=A0A1C7MFR7_GRIFR|nr:hypothetical protein A0H81_04923 [Grifola frondosa]
MAPDGHSASLSFNYISGNYAVDHSTHDAVDRQLDAVPGLDQTHSLPIPVFYSTVSDNSSPPPSLVLGTADAAVLKKVIFGDGETLMSMSESEEEDSRGNRTGLSVSGYSAKAILDPCAALEMEAYEHLFTDSKVHQLSGGSPPRHDA